MCVKRRLKEVKCEELVMEADGKALDIKELASIGREFSRMICVKAWDPNGNTMLLLGNLVCW